MKSRVARKPNGNRTRDQIINQYSKEYGGKMLFTTSSGLPRTGDAREALKKVVAVAVAGS